MYNKYVIKGFFENGSSVGPAETLEQALSTFTRIISNHSVDPFLTRVEVWERSYEQGTRMIMLHDNSGVKELTPALEQLVNWRVDQARGRKLNNAQDVTVFV